MESESSATSHAQLPLQLFSPNTAATSVLIVRQLQGSEALRVHPEIKPLSERTTAG
ncbi:hypothetical protein [Brevibacterium marinum]|uniref:Uncharacterized protein n=1 Tax=Brevibacterium marinum TaxID=418643 RepID=A0A846RWC5_9MICO|nr:hypothetical protein [Brevibacterium marinum]NJC55198.1 hypothetical protein [Brevibacterium marinum]